MSYRRRYIAVTLLSSWLTCATVTDVHAGPLLDWLFQRNRSQGVSQTAYRAGGPYPSNPYNSAPYQPRRYRDYRAKYRANTQASYQANYRGSTQRGGFGCCLFGNRGWGRSNQTAAAHPNARTTVGYAPQSACRSGWCRQTVVKYVPQVAYRTAYHAVPVTTYKTSTTINPANGLPLTCTRPCTSYTYQARRVPYTTYRPVYTTVPVADPMAQGWQNTLPAASSYQQPPSYPPAPAVEYPPGGAAQPPSLRGSGSPYPAAPPVTTNYAPTERYRANYGGTAWQPLTRTDNQTGGWTTVPNARHTTGYAPTGGGWSSTTTGQAAQATPWTPVTGRETRGYAPPEQPAAQSPTAWQPRHAAGGSGSVHAAPHAGPNGRSGATSWEPATSSNRAPWGAEAWAGQGRQYGTAAEYGAPAAPNQAAPPASRQPQLAPSPDSGESPDYRGYSPPAQQNNAGDGSDGTALRKWAPLQQSAASEPPRRRGMFRTGNAQEALGTRPVLQPSDTGVPARRSLFYDQAVPDLKREQPTNWSDEDSGQTAGLMNRQPQRPTQQSRQSLAQGRATTGATRRVSTRINWPLRRQAVSAQAAAPKASRHSRSSFGDPQPRSRSAWSD